MLNVRLQWSFQTLGNSLIGILKQTACWRAWCPRENKKLTEHIINNACAWLSLCHISMPDSSTKSIIIYSLLSVWGMSKSLHCTMMRCCWNMTWLPPSLSFSVAKWRLFVFIVCRGHHVSQMLVRVMNRSATRYKVHAFTFAHSHYTFLYADAYTDVFYVHQCFWKTKIKWVFLPL